MTKRFLSLFMAIIIVASTMTSTAQAITADSNNTNNNPGSFFDENFYNINEIAYYNPHCTDGARSEITQLAGKDNTEKILNFFMRKGLNFAGGASFVANMIQESGLNPAIIQGGRIAPDDYTLEPNVGFGLVQWTDPGRQQKFSKFMKDSGVNVTDLSGQLEYVWKEVNESYPKTISALRAVDNTEDGAVAGAVIVHGPPDPGYEASGDSPEAVLRVRGGNAREIFKKYNDAPALAGSTAEKAMVPNGEGSGDAKTVASATTNGSPTTNCSTGDNENANAGVLAKLIAKYAWHEYTAGRTDQQIEYTAAVAKAKDENRYVGGAGGNDCGAFVSLSMQDSGYEKKYNSGYGNTLTQIKWLEDSKNGWEKVLDGKRETGYVAINEDHTYMYVDKKKEMPDDWQTNIASASYPDRAPMAGTEGEQDPNFTWYRKKVL